MSEVERSGGSLPDAESDSLMSIPFQIEADMRKGPPSSAVIRLHGRIGEKQSQLLERITAPLLKANIDYAVVDLCDVLSIDPSPVGALVDFAMKRKKAGVKQPCALSGMRPTVVQTIRAAKPPKVFTAFKELRDATKSLKLRGLPDMYVAGTRPANLNMRVMVKVIPHGARVAVVSPYGYIQQPEAELLGKILRRVSLMQAQSVVIDLSGISYANSHALGSLLSCASAWEKVYEQKGVALTGAKAGIKLALTALGASRVALVCDSVEEALAALDAKEKLPVPAEVPVSEKSEAAVREEKAEEDAAGDEAGDEESDSGTPDKVKDADTSTWILKNVQAILRTKAKQALEGESRQSAQNDEGEESKQSGDGSEKKKRTSKSKTVKKDKKKTDK